MWGKSWFKDKKGYPRDKVSGRLIHREVAYREVYKKGNYSKPFSHYHVHHKDKKKNHFEPDNLEILTPEEHVARHGKTHFGGENYSGSDNSNGAGIIFVIVIILLISIAFCALKPSPEEMQPWRGTPSAAPLVIDCSAICLDNCKLPDMKLISSARDGSSCSCNCQKKNITQVQIETSGGPPSCQKLCGDGCNQKGLTTDSVSGSIIYKIFPSPARCYCNCIPKDWYD